MTEALAPIDAAAGRTADGPGDAGGDQPSREARLAALVALAAAVLAIALVAVGLVRSVDPSGVLLAGTLGTGAEGDGRSVAVGDRIPRDVQVRAGGDGASIRVGATDLELAADTIVVFGEDRVEVVGGSVLVAGRDAALVHVGSAELRGRGVWRVDLGVAGRVATYQGRVQVDDGARALQLGRYEQVDVRGGEAGGAAVPLRYQERDPWDRAHLGDALGVDRLARQLATSLTASYGSDLRSPAFFGAFAGADQHVVDRLDELAPRELDGRVGPPADVLLGITVVDALVVDAGFLPGPALSRVVELRRGGAAWGVVLVTHDLGTAAFGAAAGRALDRAVTDAADDEAGDAAGAGSSTGGSSPADGSPDPRGTERGSGTGAGRDGSAGASSEGAPSPPPSPRPPASPAPAPTPAPPADVTPDDGPLAPVDELLREGTESLTDLLDGVGGSVSGALGGG